MSRDAFARTLARMKKLYLIHCGFYDEELSDGVYEFHVNLPVVAVSPEEARARVRELPAFKRKRMHVDGIEELTHVGGHRIEAVEDPAFTGPPGGVTSRLYRDF